MGSAPPAPNANQRKTVKWRQ
ncbi:hypothetical protein YPPY19_0969, partial [Yersinia pestis PY-19]